MEESGETWEGGNCPTQYSLDSSPRRRTGIVGASDSEKDYLENKSDITIGTAKRGGLGKNRSLVPNVTSTGCIFRGHTA